MFLSVIYDRISTYMVKDASDTGNYAYFARKSFKVQFQSGRGDVKSEYFGYSTGPGHNK